MESNGESKNLVGASAEPAWNPETKLQEYGSPYMRGRKKNKAATFLVEKKRQERAGQPF